MKKTVMRKTVGGVALAITTAIALSACTTRETRIVQPVAVMPAGSTTIIVPERNPDIVVDID